jgi:succinoglycan biosynthesis protein ExoM
MPCDWQAVSRDFLMEHAARGDRRAAEILRGLLLSEEPPPALGGQADVVRVAIGVCTALRPRMLVHCLESLGAQIVRAGVEVEIVVADNEPGPGNQRLVHGFAAGSPFPVHYVHQPRRGIPQARNAVLAQCRRLNVDWVAFTDDDCWASPMWLTGLLEGAARYKADVVYGRREFVYPLPAPFWAAREHDHPAEGQTLPHAGTHNVLFAAWLVCHGNGAGMDFDERLAHGEDTDFFYRAVQRGARIVSAHTPVVFETVSPERATLNYQTRRAYHYAASRSSFHRRYNGVASASEKLAARCVFQVPMAVSRLLAAPFVWPFSELTFKVLVIKGTSRLAGAAGAAAGLLGYHGNPYQTIDGF